MKAMTQREEELWEENLRLQGLILSFEKEARKDFFTTDHGIEEVLEKYNKHFKIKKETHGKLQN